MLRIRLPLPAFSGPEGEHTGWDPDGTPQISDEHIASPYLITFWEHHYSSFLSEPSDFVKENFHTHGTFLRRFRLKD